MSDSMDEGIPEEEVEKSELERKEEKPAVKNVTAAVSSDTGTDVKSSPLAKKLAKEKGIDLS
ncbi:MAG: pyruvate dehydrogenase, partial [Elusimicrobia bacterium CG_4_10_14_0_8_um_filter_37_32]